MINVLIILCCSLALVTLFILAIIDLRIRLLPNKYVGLFFFLGIAFHFLTYAQFTGIADALLGIFAGGGLLLLVRTIANKIYQRDTLGLGDVKLMGAAGLWLGFTHIFLAISIGAFAGLLHGIAHKFYQQHKTKQHIPISGLSIPAGPGFIMGILAVAFMKFWSLPLILGF